MSTAFPAWREALEAQLDEARAELASEEAGIVNARIDLQLAAATVEAATIGMERLDINAQLAGPLARMIADAERRRGELAAALPSMVKRVAGTQRRVDEIEMALRQLEVIAVPVTDVAQLEAVA